MILKGGYSAPFARAIHPKEGRTQVLAD